MPRASRSTMRGKCRHAVGRASTPAASWIAHSRVPVRLKNTQSPLLVRAMFHASSEADSALTKRGTVDDPGITCPDDTRCTTRGSAATVHVRQHAPVCRHA